MYLLCVMIDIQRVMVLNSLHSISFLRQDWVQQCFHYYINLL